MNRHVLGFLVAALAVAPVAADAAGPILLKLPVGSSLRSPVFLRATEPWVEEINKKGAGIFHVKIYPPRSLNSPRNVYDRLVNGVYELAYGIHGPVAGKFPKIVGRRAAVPCPRIDPCVGGLLEPDPRQGDRRRIRRGEAARPADLSAEPAPFRPAGAQSGRPQGAQDQRPEPGAGRHRRIAGRHADHPVATRGLRGGPARADRRHRHGVDRGPPVQGPGGDAATTSRRSSAPSPASC